MAERKPFLLRVERELLDVADNPDDLNRSWRAVAVIYQQTGADRLQSIEPLTRQRFVDDGDRARAARVLVRERPASLDRNPHRFEIAGQHDPIGRGGFVAGLRLRAPLDNERAAPEVAVDRQMIDGAGRLHARQRAH